MKFRHALTLLALLISAPSMAAEFHGLLRARDLSPFGFLRLDMRPAPVETAEPRRWAFETEFATQNTWAMSPQVEKYLTGLEQDGRRPIGETELAAIRDLPGENYLVDLEMTVVDATLHYRISPHLSAYLITSAVSYDGGFLDSAIERFHEVFGLSTFGRPAAARNNINVIYDLKSTSFAYLDGAPSRGGLLDPTVGLRYSGIQLGGGWQMSLEGAVKVAIDGKRPMLSTGRSDYGLQAAAQWRGVRQAFYANASAVYFSGGDFLVRHERQVIPTVILGYEYALTENTNVILQGYASTSAYSHDETDLQELLGNEYQATVGIRHRRGDMLYSFGMTENVQNINNTPDIGFQLGVTWLP